MKNLKIKISLSIHLRDSIDFEQSKNPFWVSFTNIERDFGTTFRLFISSAFGHDKKVEFLNVLYLIEDNANKYSV